MRSAPRSRDPAPGNDRIVVEVPGLQDTSKLKEFSERRRSLNSALSPSLAPIPPNRAFGSSGSARQLPVEKRVMVQGEDLTDAQPGFDSRTQEPIVNFRFNIRGGQGLARSPRKMSANCSPSSSTARLSPRRASLVHHRRFRPNLRHFTVESANNLSILLRAGALPRNSRCRGRTVGPGLGQDSIERSKRAA